MDTRLTYDPDGRFTTTVTDSLGHVTTYHLNEAHQAVAEVDPLGHRTIAEWDVTTTCRYARTRAATRRVTGTTPPTDLVREGPDLDLRVGRR
ncbi:hypothetical protein [Actinoallomurus acaciae]|uniref:YD repeat-containing protein n=1 Tax=Actinoallomurus acaciae TaxID=502577 RepID=A0ABV5YK81_9ACTN